LLFDLFLDQKLYLGGRTVIDEDDICIFFEEESSLSGELTWGFLLSPTFLPFPPTLPFLPNLHLRLLLFFAYSILVVEV